VISTPFDYGSGKGINELPNFIQFEIRNVKFEIRGANFFMDETKPFFS
jgi:hypothetical protein